MVQQVVKLAIIDYTIYGESRWEILAAPEDIRQSTLENKARKYVRQQEREEDIEINSVYMVDRVQDCKGNEFTIKLVD